MQERYCHFSPFHGFFVGFCDSNYTLKLNFSKKKFKRNSEIFLRILQGKLAKKLIKNQA
ncbi:hypothetical protein mhp442 [Mesomycoplasma hyopneumoniae 232]|uniref:Uncharacterized protein n=1 Tax=Mesomycoplasma hyopneumoniae (strain 232) TaxID=295358 RepID=Q600L3_MESH2|nr:hypothetical protein mhp442 [Mesomycoplasma hyopneumoniae 232]